MAIVLFLGLNLLFGSLFFGHRIALDTVARVVTSVRPLVTREDSFDTTSPATVTSPDPEVESPNPQSSPLMNSSSNPQPATSPKSSVHITQHSSGNVDSHIKIALNGEVTESDSHSANGSNVSSVGSVKGVSQMVIARTVSEKSCGSPIETNAGTEMRLTFTNTSKDLLILAIEKYGSLSLKAGKSGELNFTADTVGTYSITCGSATTTLKVS